VDARLPAHVEVSGFLRAAQAAGDFGMVLHRGDREGGTLLIILLDKQGLGTLYERMPQRDGSRKWTLLKSQIIDNKSDFEDYLDRRKCQDPDLWIVELTVAEPQRFIQQTLSGA
jgi:hypothetical protein